MLRFKYIEMRNFMSFGNLAQRVELDCSPLTLILGINNDVTSAENSEETRNGVGKSSVIQALNFALYGKSIGNKIKMANLVNKTNKKNCEVTLVFEKDNIEYKIIRMRSPTTLKFYINNTDWDDLKKEEDQAQGDSRDSQHVIEEILGMSQELFTQFVTITTNTDTFLGLGAAKQRQIIEEILTITQLSEKADKLKETLKTTKDAISREKFRVETVEASNMKIYESIKNIEASSTTWANQHEQRMSQLITELTKLAAIDVDEAKTMLETKAQADVHNTKIAQAEQQLINAERVLQQWEVQRTAQVKQFTDGISQLSAIDIDAELQAHADNDAWQQLKVIFDTNTAEYNRLQKDIRSATMRQGKHKQEITRLETQLASTEGAKCPTCGGELDACKHDEIVAGLESRIKAETELHTEATNDITQAEAGLAEIQMFDMPQKSITHYPSANEAYQHQANVESLNNEVQRLSSEVNPHEPNVQAASDVLKALGDIQDVPDSVFNDMNALYAHTNTVQRLETEKANLETQHNPYIAQINTLQEDSIQKIDYDELNRLRKILEHQDFLVKLLTNKNSFVRKRIIDQNLSFLNSRLVHYVEKAGSMHTVNFMNDLSVDITHMGENYDFDNLSRGEKNRVIIALALAFRDTFESLNFGINVLMIDELLDNGLDQAGTNACYKMLNDLSNQRDKNCFLITHREELQSRCENIMMVVKENGFTTVEQNDGESL